MWHIAVRNSVRKRWDLSAFADVTGYFSPSLPYREKTFINIYILLSLNSAYYIIYYIIISFKNLSMIACFQKSKFSNILFRDFDQSVNIFILSILCHHVRQLICHGTFVLPLSDNSLEGHPILPQNGHN